MVQYNNVFNRDPPYNAIILTSNMFYCIDCIVFCPVVVVIINNY